MRIQYTAQETAVSVSVNCRPQPSRTDDPTPPPIKVRASVFFDGTGNNMFNTRQREIGGQRYAWSDSFNGSFMNDYSNVAKLANYILTNNTVDDYHFSIYVEGIGTQAADGDDIRGSAVGDGGRGVPQRVLRALEQLTATITSLDENNSRNIIELKIDTFGFSRGAACSRHFGYRIFNYFGRLDANSRPLIVRLRDRGFRIQDSNTRIPLMGLFDTVSSFGSNHDDDVRELKLDFTAYLSQIDKIVHIAAAEEYRLNFRLTNTDSADRKAQVIFLPGAHSDIGGGYNDQGDTSETQFKVLEVPHTVRDSHIIWNVQRMYVDIMIKLIQKGNYRQEEFVAGDRISSFLSGRRSLQTPSSSSAYIGDAVIVNRTYISNRYSKIPLKIMSEKFADAGLKLDESFNLDINLSPFLSSIYSLLNNNGHSADYWSSATNEQCGFDIVKLRHNFLHTSSHYNDYYPGVGFIYRAQFYKNGAYIDVNTDTSVIGNGLGFEFKRKVNRG